MILPAFLKPGDEIALVSPGKIILESELEEAFSFFKSWGLRVHLGKNALNKWNRFAGRDEDRLSDFQNALDNPDIKAIICNRGGYGSIRIISDLNFSQLDKTPKWIVGYSDVTVFHSHLHTQLNMCSIHGTMPLNMVSHPDRMTSIEKLKDVLFGNIDSNSSKSNPLNRIGTITGKVVGGNLSILASLVGTQQDIHTEGKILFIEDLCEELYHLDRMMYQLKNSGKFEKLAGLVVGSFSDMTDVSSWFDSNMNAYQIIAEHVKDFSFPVAFNFPGGHEAKNYPLVLGRNYELVVKEEEVLLK